MALLVVDDDPLVRAFTVRALSDRREVRAYAEAASAIGAVDAARGDIELVIVDVEMPGELDGIGLALALSVIEPRIPVVLMSGNHGALDRGRALANVRACLRKPFTLATLRAAVEGGPAAIG